MDELAPDLDLPPPDPSGIVGLEKAFLGIRLGCVGRFGEAYERCLAEREERELVKDEAQEERHVLRNENRADRRDHRSENIDTRRNTQVELAEMGATLGQLGVQFHGDSNDSANQLFSDFFGSGMGEMLMGGGAGAAPAAPADTGPDTTTLVAVAGGLVVVVLGAIAAAFVASR